MIQKTVEAGHRVGEGHVVSADGTRIGYLRAGEGPAVVFVHGSISTHTDWMRVARLLAGQFTCYSMDRRGRGRSGHGEGPYSMERECEDIEAVLGAAGEDAALVGHSFGAIGALLVAMRRPVRKLVLYEPPLPAGGPIAGEKHAAYAAAIARGDIDGALQIGLENFSRIPLDEIALMRASRGWERLRTLAPGWVRELEVMDGLSGDVERYRSLGCPAMLLVGSESPEHPLKDASRALMGVLRGARVEILAGEGHVAMRTAPELLARLIGEFLAA